MASRVARVVRIGPVLRLLGVVCAGAAMVLLAVAAMSLVGAVRTFDVAGIPVSVASPSRLVLEAAAAMAIGVLLGIGSGWRRPRAAVAGSLVLLALACIAESDVRRVGDGHEYLAMAVGVAAGEGAGGTEDFYRRLDASLTGEPGMEGIQLWDHAVGSRDGGRREFVHFGLYSVLASPMVSIARGLGGHAGHGFAALNILLYGAAAWWLTGRLGRVMTVFVMASPIVWWLDKAHPDVMIFALLAIAMSCVQDRPRPAIILTAVVAAQNPALGVVWLAVTVGASLEHGARRLLPAIGIGVAIIATHPVYYWSTIGQLTGLRDGVLWQWPSLQRYLAPLVDLDIGVLVHFPALPLMLAVLARRGELPKHAPSWIAAVAVLGVLAVAAQTTNLNHAGTYNPSRYGIWLVALAVPLLHAAIATARPAPALQAIAAASIVLSLVAVRPSRPERHLDHTALAGLALAAAQPLYRPSPEVFAERTTGTEVDVPLPAAFGDCATILLSGAYAGAWPVPCEPAPVPAECTAPGQLCYAQRRHGSYAFNRVDSSAFSYTRAVHAWRAVSDLDWIAGPIDWRSMREVRVESPTSWVGATEGLGHVFALQNASRLVAWIAARGPNSTVTLHVPRPARACVRDAATHDTLSCVEVRPDASVRLVLPSQRELLLTAE